MNREDFFFIAYQMMSLLNHFNDKTRNKVLSTVKSSARNKLTNDRLSPNAVK